MRNMSFFLTTQQFRDRTKDVTRRFGWWNLKPGDRVMGVEKGQGIKKGELVRMDVIEIVSTRPEKTTTEYITQDECNREGFPDLTPKGFIAMLTKHYGKIDPDRPINRIEFKYIDLPDCQVFGPEAAR